MKTTRSMIYVGIVGLVLWSAARGQNLGYLRIVGDTYEIEAEAGRVDAKVFTRLVADIQLAVGLRDRGGGVVQWVQNPGAVQIENFSGYPFLLKLDPDAKRAVIATTLVRAYEKAGNDFKLHSKTFATVVSGVRLLNSWLAALGQENAELSGGVHSFSGRIDVTYTRSQLVGMEIVFFDYLIDYGTIQIEPSKRELPVVQIGLRRRGSTSFDGMRKSVLIFADGAWKFMTP